MTEQIKKIFQANANTEYAEAMSRYMRYKFEYYGIKSPIRRSLQKAYLRDNKEIILPIRVEYLHQLWHEPKRELQYFAMDFMFMTKKHIQKNDLEIIEYMITHKSWWDTVDFLAGQVAGYYFKQFPETRTEATQRWICSGDMWLERSAIIHQLHYKAETDWEMLKEYILFKIDSKEFFIQKVIGWALRQYAYTEPKRVLDFVESHDLKPLSRREAIRRIR